MIYTEKLFGGVKWGLGFRNVDGEGEYVPDTLLEGDVRNNIHEAYRIIATYIKTAGEETFTQRVYLAKKIDYEKLTYPKDWGNRPKLEPEVKKEIVVEETVQETVVVEMES